jgi:hypothetical protein
MSNELTGSQDWPNRGKTIRQLIKELQSFENQDLLVEISIDGGQTQRPISLVKRSEGTCLLTFYGA